MTWRALKEADLEECLAIDPRSAGDSLVGRQTARQIWRHLLRSASFNSAVVDAETKAGARRIISFGASLFLDPVYAEGEIRSPQPDCNSRIFAAIAAGEPVIRSAASLTRDGAEGALDLILLCSSFLHHAFDPQQQEEVSVLLPHALVQLHAGYRIRRILMETTSERMRALAESSGVWKTLSRFPHQDRALMIVTAKEVQTTAGFTVLAPLFRYTAPALGLREAEKHLLAEAMAGETDAELAKLLHLSISSVKKRWTSIYARIAETRPELFAGSSGPAKRDGRGQQKRHRILNYVRSHPEEIRPFKSYPKA